MPEAMSFAELTEQFAELLPARTVLSLFARSPWHAGRDETAGDPGTRGANGKSIPGTAMWVLFGGSNQSDSGSSYHYGLGDAVSRNG